MNCFSFLSNTAKTLSLSADCSAGTLPDLVKAIFGQKLFGKIADLHLQAQVGGSGGKRGGERSPYKVSTLPAARRGGPAFLIKWCKRHGLCPSRSGSEHLSLLPGFCIFSLRPFGLCASNTACTDTMQTLFQAAFSRSSLFPLGMASQADSFPIVA